jgi:hypothetical protein
LNGLNGWNELNKVEIEPRTPVLMGLLIQSTASRQEQNTQPDLYFSFERQRRKVPAALDKFRESGTTVTPTIDHSLLDEVLAGK